jgi:hypothetical protein
VVFLFTEKRWAMLEGIEQMVDDALWDVRYGTWFSGPYRLWWSVERGDWCLWYCEGVLMSGVLSHSRLLKRGFDTLGWAKKTVEAHRELMKTRMLEKPLAP